MRHIVACIGVAALVLLNQTASAGPIRDRIEARIANAQHGNDQLDAEDQTSTSDKAFAQSGVSIQRNIAYGADSLQRMDVYIPRDAHGAAVVFMVHGGAWFFGDKASGGVVENKAARWLAKDMIFVSANYRTMPNADPLTQANDVAMALAKAQKLAASWGGDPSRFVLIGHSAGAHLIALIAAAPAIVKQQGVQPWLGTILLDSAAVDMVQIMNRQHMRFYDRAFGNDPMYWQSVSPFHQLLVSMPPLLAICSTQRNDSCPQARGFVAKATGIGVRATILPVDLTHKEINRDLGLAGAYTDSVEAFMRTLGVGG